MSPMKGKLTTLGRKQGLPDSEHWRRVMQHSVQAIGTANLDNLIDRTVESIRAEARVNRLAHAWSGGKDSQVLRWLFEQAGQWPSVLGMTTGLEWPAMLGWLTDNMPMGCDVIAQPLDLAWLRANPWMLFPQPGQNKPGDTGGSARRWFREVQHKSQRTFYARHKLDVLAVGRRRLDGNFVGKNAATRYTARGITRWSPLADWTHEEVFAVLMRERIPMPPCYDWPRGFQIGTGPWPARQWTENHDHGWSECWTIDPMVVRLAATQLPEAADWMVRNGQH